MRHIPFLDIQKTYQENQRAIDEACARVMNSGQWILGPELEAFESEYATYCGTKYCIGVGNGLDALFLALKALEIGRGDEVIVPAHTFVATWVAVTRTGATPIAAEPDTHTYMPCSRTIEACITPRTRAVIAVHLYGSVSGIEEIASLCAVRGIPLIEDAAQAHGSRSSHARAGNHGVMGCFSFYPSKNLGAIGDGGAVVTNESSLDCKIRALRNYGSSRRYVHEVEGVNSRLDELQAAILRTQLQCLDSRNASRRVVADLYMKRLRAIDAVQVPFEGLPGSHVWHLFVIQVKHRDALQQYLHENDIETLVHYPVPVYRHSPFMIHAPKDKSISDCITEQILSLPMGAYLQENDINRVCDVIAGFFHQEQT